MCSYVHNTLTPLAVNCLQRYMWLDLGKPIVWDLRANCTMHVFNSSIRLKFVEVQVLWCLCLTTLLLTVWSCHLWWLVARYKGEISLAYFGVSDDGRRLDLWGTSLYKTWELLKLNLRMVLSNFPICFYREAMHLWCALLRNFAQNGSIGLLGSTVQP